MTLRENLFKVYWKIEKIIVPSLKYAQEIYEDTLNTNVNLGKKWLDIGCGHHILSPWREKQESRLVSKSKMIVGIDYDLFSLKNHKFIDLKVRGDITSLPFKNNSFDLVTANMVLEHLKIPKAQFFEIKRILKPGGIFIFHTPNILGYTTILAKFMPKIFKKKCAYFLQGRREDDIFNTYYRINNIRNIYKFAHEVGYEIVEIKLIPSSAQFIMIPPLLIPELIWLRILTYRPFKSLRTNIIGILRKIS